MVIINKIEIGESCFGPIIRVNEIDLINEIPENNASELEAQALQNEVLTLLFEQKQNISHQDWSDILRIIAENAKNSNNEYIFKTEESDGYSESCEQCGNYNYLTVYKI